MAVRNVFKTDSIFSLLYEENNGEYRGYKTDLLRENPHKHIKNWIFCCQCKGIGRKPRLSKGKTFCTPCSIGTRATIDSRVDEIVSQLNSRCPLLTRGCDWLGQLGDITQHMSVCEKLRIDCVMGCGKVLERCETDKHLKTCPLRGGRCEHCGEKVLASEANHHITSCSVHPDGFVLCPYFGLGCYVLEIKRKNLDAHLADNYIGHQKLLLREIRQLRRENDNLRDESENLKKRNVTIHDRGFNLATFVFLIFIAALYLYLEINRMDDNILSIQSNVKSIRPLLSNSLPNATYLNDYIRDRDDTLHGVEWTHGNVAGETYYGPVFYLGTCKLKLHVEVSRSVSNGRRDAYYYIKRLTGYYEDVSNTCHITYIHLYSVNIRDNSRDNFYHLVAPLKLEIGGTHYIDQWHGMYDDGTLPSRTIRMYFDFE